MADSNAAPLASEPTPPPDQVIIQGKRRPSPYIAQMKRTFYLLRRNTLAMVGLAIVLFFAFVGVYALFVPVPGDYLVLYCGSAGSGGAPPASGCIPICTYAQGTTAPGPGCYQVPLNGYGIVPPTVSVSPFSAGPLPMGSMTTSPATPIFYSVYQGMLKGTTWSLGISVVIVAVGASIGFVLGAVAGYRGGGADEIIMRITDIFLSIPGLLLVIVFLAVFGASVTSLQERVYILIVGFIITWWPLYARLVRSQVLVSREQKYVEAAKASGAKTGRILRKHIMPNAVFPVFVQLSLDVGTIPLLLGAIVFLGYHIFPTQFFPEWGTMAAIPASNLAPLIQYCSLQALDGLSCVFPWWMFFFPGVVLFLFAISVNFLSDGLRDALDPRLRR